MYKGKHSVQGSESSGRTSHARSAAPSRRSGSARKPIGLFVALVLLLGVVAGGTIAWLTDSMSITNSMEPGNVPVSINESISGNTKTSVKIKNEGNVQAYIRVVVISNSLDTDGNIVPNTSSNTVTTNGTWTPLGDYYYYNGIVEPGASVELLGESIDFSSKEVVVMAQSVQVLGNINGGTASQALWGVTYSNGTWA